MSLGENPVDVSCIFCHWIWWFPVRCPISVTIWVVGHQEFLTVHPCLRCLSLNGHGMSFPTINMVRMITHGYGTFAKPTLYIYLYIYAYVHHICVPKPKIHHCSSTCAFRPPGQLQAFRPTEVMFFFSFTILTSPPHHQYRISYWWKCIPDATENLLATFQVSKRAVWRARHLWWYIEKWPCWIRISLISFGVYDKQIWVVVSMSACLLPLGPSWNDPVCQMFVSYRGVETTSRWI